MTKEPKYPDGNPKTIYGVKKPSDWYVPIYSAYQYAMGHFLGFLKYGHFNWRDDPVSMSTYMGAAKRHYDAMKEGEWLDPDTGIPHAALVMTNMSIIMDAKHHGTLIDDRHPTNTSMAAIQAECEPIIKALQEQYGNDGGKLNPHGSRKRSTEPTIKEGAITYG